MEDKLTIGYWGIQGAAQPTRYVLELLEIPYEDKQYTDRETWGKDKFNLGLAFPNLPYLIDGNVKLTESSALLQYVPIKGKRSDLLGGNEEDKIQVHQLLGVLGDIRTALFETMWTPKDQFDTKKASAFKDTVQPKLGLLSKYLGSKEWLTGHITVADVVLFYITDIITRWDAGQLDDHKNIKEHHERFASISQIKKYRESERFPKLIMPPIATWSG